MGAMNTAPLLALTALACACANPAPTAPNPDQPQPAHLTAEHEWLRQLAGDWTVKGESIMDPAAPPEPMEWSETARMFGDYWLISDIASDFDGVPWQGRMTIGWDSSKNAFVGTWFDSSSDFMWNYRGSLDAARRTLTLEAEGPDMTNPGHMTMFRDVLEILGPGQRSLTSWAFTNGTWVRFMSATATRR